MSFVATMLERAKAAGRRPVLYEVHGADLVPTSGDVLLDGVARARGFLRSAGVRPGDRVALLGPNSSLWVSLDLAILAEGAIAVPLYARQAPEELAGMLRDAEPAALIAADAPLAAAVASAWPEHAPIARYDEVFACAPLVEAPVALEAGATATLIYTSGTSGEPKGVMLTAGGVDHMLGVTVARLAAMSGASRAEDRVFHYLPFCFAGSRIMLWSQLFRGNPLMMSTDLTRLQEEMATAAPHYMLNVPALLERIRAGVERKIAERGDTIASVYANAIAAHEGRGGGLKGAAALALARTLVFPRIARLIGPNLEFLACGSASLAEGTQRWFQAIGIPVYQIYGLTETTAIVTIDDVANVRPGRVGHAIDGCEIRVGEGGELLCRGPNLFAGYWRRPDATDEMLRDGWLHTGDQVEVDATGSVKIIGRVKDVLVPESGHNVAPLPIEERLVAAATGVEQAVVVGHGRPHLVAIVTGSAGDAELERAREQVNAQLPHYQRLRRLWRAPEPFTVENGLLTANQKLRRRAIETRYRDAIEALYARGVDA